MPARDPKRRVAAALAILGDLHGVAREFARRELAARPELAARHGAQVAAKSADDAVHHLQFLAQALRFGRAEIFSDYVAWAGDVRACRGNAAADFDLHLGHLAEVLAARLPGEQYDAAATCIHHAVQAAKSLGARIPTGGLQGDAAQFVDALARRDTAAASAQIMRLVHTEGRAADDVFHAVFRPALYEIGRRWQVNQVTVLDEHYATAVVSSLIEKLAVPPRAASAGRVALCACAAGEMHDVGLRLVADALQRAGWSVVFAGGSTPTSDLLRFAVDAQPQLLALSCSYVPVLHEVEAFLAALRALPECRRTRVLVGGLPFGRYEGLWRQLGADGCADDAACAVAEAERLLALDPA